ncbi:HNH endonuclease [Halostella litorea]|uniref:HNH endonuclease n=1 Tax=Halostella litorea TaxID=2528831 RepID=UPI0013871135|nr:HNH endonuclease [Halostella litorea]
MTDSDQSSTSKPYRDEERLRELYHDRGLTTREIADELGCTNGTVSKYLNEFDIDTRPNWKAGVEAAREANRVEKVTLRTLPAGYEYWTSKEGEDRTGRIVYVHRLLAVAEHGFEAVADSDVHHSNHVPWDNRPENIELMDASDHGQYHSKEYWERRQSAENDQIEQTARTQATLTEFTA